MDTIALYRTHQHQWIREDRKGGQAGRLPLKPLERRSLVVVHVDEADRRNRLVQITGEGVALLKAALPSWRETHARLDSALGEGVPDRMRTDLRAMPLAAATLAGAADTE